MSFDEPGRPQANGDRCRETLREIVLNVLAHIDGFILNCFERFSHFMQRTFGTKAVDWERFCLMASAAITMTRESKIAGLALAIFTTIITILMFTLTYFRIPTPPGTMNPRKIRNQFSRPFCILFCLTFLWNDLRTGNLWYELWRFADYFSACDDLPPGESQVRKFVNSLKAGFRQPVPVGASFRLTKTSK